MQHIAEVVQSLHQIIGCTDQLLREEFGVLSDDQQYFVERVAQAVKGLMALVPLLEMLLAECDQPFDAVKQMSTEWRTPFTTIRGYSQLLLQGYAGALTENQQHSLRQIITLADDVWTWSHIGNADRM